MVIFIDAGKKLLQSLAFFHNKKSKNNNQNQNSETDIGEIRSLHNRGDMAKLQSNVLNPEKLEAVGDTISRGNLQKVGPSWRSRFIHYSLDPDLAYPLSFLICRISIILTNKLPWSPPQLPC